jgi:hypothetical protein
VSGPGDAEGQAAGSNEKRARLKSQRPTWRWRLPRRYELAHELCFYLHATLVGYLQFAIREHLFDVTIVGVLPEEEQQIASLRGDALLAWLEQNGRREVLTDLAYRNAFRALLGDACDYIYEALRCSEKGKLTVAFSLIRKPLRENLLYLEYQLADRDAFVENFSHGSRRAFSADTLVEKGKARAIVHAAMRRCDRPGWIDADFLFDLRYSKESHFSLERLWNKAVHLVTTSPHYATEPQNLNFVFSDRAAIRSQWRAFYELVPPLLFHTVEVSSAVLRSLDASLVEPSSQRSRRAVGFMLYGQELFGASQLVLQGVTCPRCEQPILDTYDTMLRLYLASVATCGHCGLEFAPWADPPPGDE